MRSEVAYKLPNTRSNFPVSVSPSTSAASSSLPAIPSIVIRQSGCRNTPISSLPSYGECEMERDGERGEESSKPAVSLPLIVSVAHIYFFSFSPPQLHCQHSPCETKNCCYCFYFFFFIIIFYFYFFCLSALWAALEVMGASPRGADVDDFSLLEF